MGVNVGFGIMSVKVDKFFNSLSEGRMRNYSCLCGSGKKNKKCHGKDRIINLSQKREIEKILQAREKLDQLQKQCYRSKVIQEYDLWKNQEA